MIAIEQAREEWAYAQMKEHYQASPSALTVWIEVSPSFYWQALGVMPPIYVNGGFMVGEAECHNARGEAVYAGFTSVRDRHYALYATKAAFAGRITELVDELSKGVKVYA